MIAYRSGIVVVLIVSILATGSLAQNSRIPKWIQEEKFLRACEFADLEAIKLHLKNGISPNTRDKFGQPALIRTVMGFDVFRKTPDAVKLLLDAGADINAVNEFGSTALFWTIQDPDVPENPQGLLLRSGIDEAKRDVYGSTYRQRKSFDNRAEENDSFAWRLLIEGGINWSAEWETIQAMSRHSNSASAMMAGAYYGIIFGRATGRFGTDWQVEIDSNKENYLFYLATRRNIYNDEMFTIRSAAIDMPNANGETPVIRAARFDNSLLVRKLLTLGANADRRDSESRSALEYAVEYDYFDSTLLLLTATDPRISDKNGRTPLMTAAENGYRNPLRAYSAAIQMARILPAAARKERGKDRTAMLALAAKYRAINVNQQDNEGMTALMLAAQASQVEAVKTLKLFKANALLKNKKGKTALDLARSNGNPEIIKLLSPRR